MITDPLFYAVAIPAVTAPGLGQGRILGARIALPAPHGPGHIAGAGRGHHPADPDRSGRGVGLGLSARMGPPQHPDPAPGSGVRASSRAISLAARVSDAAVALAVGVICVAFALRRMVLERGATPPKPASADVPRGLLWGWASGFTSMIAHAGGPPFQIYVLPQRLPRDVFVGTGAIVLRAHQLDQGAALLRRSDSSRRKTWPRPRPCSRWPSPPPGRGSGSCGACRRSGSTP